MALFQKELRPVSAADLLRHLFLSWLIAAAVEFLLLPSELRALDALRGLAQMSLLRVGAVTAFCAAVLTALNLFWDLRIFERWGMVGAFAILAGFALRTSFTAAFAGICALVLLILTVYALFGWQKQQQGLQPVRAHGAFLWLAVLAAGAFFLFVSIWTVCRVLSFCTPTYDFGIFSQMFYHMMENGAPMTTVERDGLLSHFYVHVSPTYYLLLPFYCLYPKPEFLQVLQAAVMASAVIPLWKIGKLHGLSGLPRLLSCLILLLYPAFAGGAGYDIHENCFLTPLILWLLYGIDKGNWWITVPAALLTLGVKEDAAVYVAVVALYLLVRTVLRYRKGLGKDLCTGAALLTGAIVWFFLVTNFLSQTGDGVMTYRYNNFIYDGSSSLVTVIKAVLLCPMKLLYECVDKEKLMYIAQTVLPLLGLPLLTRKFDRYLLLIPYVLVNLMSDYQYQHNIFFQYNFGSIAFLMYLTVVNLSDLKLSWMRLTAFAGAAAVCAGCFVSTVVPTAVPYTQYCQTFEAYYDNIRQTLDTIPQDASAAATTFYTTYLSQRETLYDVRYCSQEHLLSAEYVALRISAKAEYTKYATNADNGFENLVKLLEKNGYTLYAELSGEMVIYRKTASAQ